MSDLLLERNVIKLSYHPNLAQPDSFLKPGVHPQLGAPSFIKIISGKMCVCTYLHIYLSLSVHTYPHEQTILVAKAAHIQEI